MEHARAHQRTGAIAEAITCYRAAPENAGNNGTPAGLWELTDETATYLTAYGPDNKGAARQMCAAVATFDHDVFERGTTTGNCVDLPV